MELKKSLKNDEMKDDHELFYFLLYDSFFKHFIFVQFYYCVYLIIIFL